MSNEKSSAKDEVRFNLRIPRNLHRALTHRAVIAKRSLNSLVVQMLEKGVAEDDEDGWKEAIKSELEMITHVRQSLDAQVDDLESRQYTLYHTWAEREGKEAAERELGRWIVKRFPEQT